MSRFWSPRVKELEPYVPGEQPKLSKLTKLNTNENPFPPSPKAIEAMQAALGDDLRLYPDPNADSLRAAIANYYGVDAKQVFVGNGSDEVLAHIFNGLFQHGRPLLFPDISYSFYPVYCQLYNIPFERIPLTDDFAIDVSDYTGINGGIIFPNPNAPTGRLLPLDEIRRLLAVNNETVVVVDEAYIDFGGESAVGLVNEYPNLLVTQTFSKSRSLAGLRVGLAIGSAELIDALDRIKNSFNSYPLGVSAQAEGVGPYSQAYLMIGGGDVLGYTDYEFECTDDFLSGLLAAGRGKKAVVEAWHGAFVFGRDAGETFFRSFYLDQACAVQLEVQKSAAGGATIREIPEHEIQRHLTDMNNSDWYGYEGELEWLAIRRRLDSEAPHYTT